MSHPPPTRCRSNGELLVKLHGIEPDGPNTYVAIMETVDGTAQALDPCAISIMRRHYHESLRTPSQNCLRNARLAEEDQLLEDAQMLMNDLRTSNAANVSAPSFPPTIVQAAEAVWFQTTQAPLRHPLKPNSLKP